MLITNAQHNTLKEELMRKNYLLKGGAAALAICLLLGGCSSAKSEAGSMAYDAKADYSYSPVEPEAVYDEGWYAEAPALDFYDNYATADINYSKSASSYSGSAGGSSASENLSAADQSALADRKLIRNVNLDMETLEFDQCIQSLERSITANGGYIQSSNVSNSSYRYLQSGKKYMRNAYYTIRIPRERLDSFVDTIGNIGNVTNKSMSSEDVTLTYLDTEARAKSLQVQQERILALLEKAEDIDSIIQLEARLSDITYQLESKESILKNYDNLVSFSTVYLNLNEVERITEVVEEPISFGQEIVNGIKDTAYDIKEGFKDFVYWFIVDLPYILFWGAIIVVAVILIVKRIKKIKAKGAAAETALEVNKTKENE